MDPSLDKNLEDIRAEVPVAVAPDLIALLYGGLFMWLGTTLRDAGDVGMGSLLLLVGFVGITTGILTIVSASPAVKLVQAIDNLLVAAVLLAMAGSGSSGSGLLDQPAAMLGFAALSIWVAFSHFGEYGRLTQLVTTRRERAQGGDR